MKRAILLASALGAAVAGCTATTSEPGEVAEVDFGRRDDGRIVIDEVVGQLIALAPLVIFWGGAASRGVAAPPVLQTSSGLHALATGPGALVLFFEVVTGFVLFRLFDVWKPGAVRWAEQRFEGGMGVMADDVVAGMYAAIGVALVHVSIADRVVASASALTLAPTLALGSVLTLAPTPTLALGSALAPTPTLALGSALVPASGPAWAAWSGGGLA